MLAHTLATLACAGTMAECPTMDTAERKRVARAIAPR